MTKVDKQLQWTFSVPHVKVGARKSDIWACDLREREDREEYVVLPED